MLMPNGGYCVHDTSTFITKGQALCLEELGQVVKHESYFVDNQTLAILFKPFSIILYENRTCEH